MQIERRKQLSLAEAAGFAEEEESGVRNQESGPLGMDEIRGEFDGFIWAIFK
jgi:hypothetical protein